MPQRTGARASALLLTAVLGLLLCGIAGAPSAAAAPKCAAPTEVPALPQGGDGTPQGFLLARARSLALIGQLDAAEKLYEVALAQPKPDPRAGQGLASVQARRLAAENCVAVAQRLKAQGKPGSAEATYRKALKLDATNTEARQALQPSAPTTAAGRVAGRWDAFYAAWVAPAVSVLVPLLVTLAVLLVAARLITPLVAPADARAWREYLRRPAWALGMLLLAGTVLVGVPAVVDRTTALEKAVPVAQRPVILGAIVLAAALIWLMARAARWLTVAIVAGVGIAVLAALYVLEDSLTWLRSDWLLLLAVALLAIVLIAAGRGHALRLAVRVTTGGQPDPAATSYVLARLQELGSAPPRGLKTPQQVDVTDLPTQALSALPAGRLAAALTRLVGLLLPSIPWRATVDAGDDDRVVVTLTRNGHTARTARVDAALFRPGSGRAAADGAPEIDMAALLTGAAAVVLTELARRHPELRPGLCGATGWQSVAAHVVATTPPAVGGDLAQRRALLAFAVDRDPGNALAYVAYTWLLGEGRPGPADVRAHAERLAVLQEEVDTRARRAGSAARGFTALRLRVAHAVTAEWLNACLADLESGGNWPASWHRADLAYRRLLDRLAEAQGNADLGSFLAQLHRVTLALFGGLVALRPPNAKEPPEPSGAWAAEREPDSLFARYDRACTLAVQARVGLLSDPPDQRVDGWLDHAQQELELAVGSDRLRALARRDPAFTALRQNKVGDPARWKDFWSVVTEPGPAFPDLPPFGTKGEALRALGIETAEDLLNAAPTDDDVPALARTLGVPRTVVRRWRALAELARPRGSRTDWLGAGDLALLLEAGIASPEELADRAAAPQQLKDDLAEAAARRGVRAPDNAEYAQLAAG